MFSFTKLFVPLGLSPFYHQTNPATVFSGEFWPSIVGLILLCSFLVLLRKHRALLVAALTYLLLIFPSFTTFRKSQEIVLFASGRYVYLASIALLSIVVCAVLGLFREKYRGVGVVGLLFVSGCFGLLAFQHSGAWASTLSLYEYAVEARPDTYIAQHNLGVEYLNTGRTDEAIEHLGIAIGIDPTRPIAYENLARALAKQGRYEEALSYTLQALALDPAKREEYEEALRKIGQAGSE
jgi:tetratricopeptide (TPR) repeat protein